MLEPSELFPEVPNLYEFPSVHADMIYDEERVSQYWKAIKNVIKPGDYVADIGTGTGLLAFLCVRAGAKHVYGIEKSNAIKWARKLANHHCIQDKITFYQRDSREVELPKKVDVIVSELVGHIAFEEGMAESLFDAKKRFLIPDGVIIPRKVNLMAVPVWEPDIYENYIDCWKSAWGINYSILRDDAIKTCYITQFKNDHLMAIPTKIINVDFEYDDQMDTLHGTTNFIISRIGNINGIGLWFDAELAQNVKLSSGPSRRTHWQQCFAPLKKSIPVENSDEFEIHLSMKLKMDKSDSFQFEFELNKCAEENQNA